MTVTVGTDPQIRYEVVPSGGVISLKLSSSSASEWQLERFVNQSGVLVSGTVLDVGSPVPPISGSAETTMHVLDIGDGTNWPLQQDLSYSYTFTTAVSGVTTDAIAVGSTLTLVQDDLTLVLVRVFQSGLRALALPKNFKNRPDVFHAMPLAGHPRLPFIAISQVQMRQEQVPVGQENLANYISQAATVTAQTSRRYSVAVLAESVEEREFYRDAVIGVFNTILGPLLNSIGQDSSHEFMVENNQVVSEDRAPGFYYSEIMLTFTGSYNVTVTSDYGIIKAIDPDPTAVQDSGSSSL